MYDFDRVVRILFSTGCVVAAVWLINYLSAVLLPFFVACLLAYLIHPVVEWNRRWLRVRPNFIAVVLALMEIVAVAGAILYFLVPYVVEEVSDMVTLLSDYAKGQYTNSSAPAWLHDYMRRYINLRHLSGMLSYDQWVGVLTKALQHTWNVLDATASVTISIVAGVFSWAVALLYMVFILIDYDKISNGFHQAVPERYSKGVFMVLNDVKRSAQMYFRGQVLIAAIVGVLFAVGFSLIGLPMAVVLGLFIGVLNLVPYLQLASIPIAVFLCLVDAVTSGGSFWSMIGWITVVYFTVQGIQDLLLTPKIMGKYMAINPVLILLSLSVWGVLLGFVGLIVALPLTSLLISYYRRYILHDHTAEPTEAAAAVSGQPVDPI